MGVRDSGPNRERSRITGGWDEERVREAVALRPSRRGFPLLATKKNA